MAMRRAIRSTSFLKSRLRLTSFSTQSNHQSTLNHTNTSNYLLSTRPLAQTKTLTSFNTPFVSQCLTYVTSSPRVVGVDEKLRGHDRVDYEPSIPVKAFLFSTSVDLKSLVEQNKSNLIPSTSRMTNYVVFKFGEGKSGSAGHTASSRESESECTYMVVYQYGSVVMFNAPNQKIDEYLKVVRNHASGWLPEMRKDEYEVKEKPSLDTWMQGGLDHILLQHLDVDGIRTIGSVLGQSIALDYYVRQVDGMVAEFTDINREMENSGTFTMRRKKLFQIVGRANSNLADVILKLGLFERSDIAWKDAKYGQIWEYLRDEFELTPRLASLDFKLKFVEHNIHFLQEILQNRRSDFLEWVIIILISVEILISLHDKFFP